MVSLMREAQISVCSPNHDGNPQDSEEQQLHTSHTQSHSQLRHWDSRDRWPCGSATLREGIRTGLTFDRDGTSWFLSPLCLLEGCRQRLVRPAHVRAQTTRPCVPPPRGTEGRACPASPGQET